MRLKTERVKGPSSEWNNGTLGAQEQPTLNSKSEKLRRNCAAGYQLMKRALSLCLFFL